jgi:hypothetical protein
MILCHRRGEFILLYMLAYALTVQITFLKGSIIGYCSTQTTGPVRLAHQPLALPLTCSCPAPTCQAGQPPHSAALAARSFGLASFFLSQN